MLSEIQHDILVRLRNRLRKEKDPLAGGVEWLLEEDKFPEDSYAKPGAMWWDGRTDQGDLPYEIYKNLLADGYIDSWTAFSTQEGAILAAAEAYLKSKE